MGEILICNEAIAAMPYYIEGIGWNVYSLEELCYYIENNTYLLEKDFMTEELCTWIANELKNTRLAEKTRDIMRLDGRLSEFVLAILLECGYCSKNTIKEILRILREMEEKTDFECNKVRADRLMEKEKYLGSIYEYRRLLEAHDAGEQTPQLIGNIWHNLGVAYARLFLFGEAIHCFEKAYTLNQNMESLRELIMAYSCTGDETGIAEVIEKYHVSEEEYARINDEIVLASTGEEVKGFKEHLEELTQSSDSIGKKEKQKAIADIIFYWKEEYRRICRI